MENNELKHYGVLGMKWGVRRTKYENKAKLNSDGSYKYDHDKIVYKKNTVAQRITSKKNEINKGKTYIAIDKLDKLKYEFLATTGNVFNWVGNIEGEDGYGYKVNLRLTKDLIAPSFNESIKSFIRVSEKIPLKDLTVDLYGSKNDQHSRYDRDLYKERTKQFVYNMKNLSVEACRNDAYLSFSKHLINSGKAKEMFFNDLKKQGYNAVIDHNDKNDYFNMPVIVFERENTLKTASTKLIDTKRAQELEYMLADLDD